MADHHDEDAPDVDYEGEEDDDDVEPQQVVVEVAEVINKPSGGSGAAGDSETDDDDGDGPRLPAKAADNKGAGGKTESEGEDGEIAASDNKVVGNNKPSQQPNDKVGTSRGYHQHDTSKIMDRALSAPREKNTNNDQQTQRGGGGRGERGSRWGEKRNHGALKRPEQEEGVGVYIPPAKRRLLEEQRKAQEATAAAASSNGDEKETIIKKQITPINKQRQSWENLQRTINGTINRLSPTTIKPLIHSLFSEANLVKGRGILVKSILKASSASPQFTPTYAALMAVINTKLPECGELLVTRCILSFRKYYKYRNRNEVTSILSLLGHLFNQGITHELLSLQILTVLLDGDPTDDSVDVAVGYMCIVGRQLCEVSPTGVHAVMERFRGLLHEGSIGRRGQYRIETLLKIKKGGFKDYPIIPDEEHLDLVEREDQITFELGLDDEGLRNEETLDTFSYDEEYDEKEEEWKKIKAEILGEDSDDESGSGSGSDGDSESGSDDDEEEEEVPDQQLEDGGDKKKTVVIEDLTETDLVHLRRTIYLTIMSSATFEECTHKLAKMDIPPGRECELINMIIECCSQERTFLRYYGLVSGRFCLLHERWQTAFEEAFATQYNTIHRLETNKLRNVAKLFGHLLHTDSVSWSVLGCIHLNEDETTSSSRIFIKILVQEMAEAMGMVTLKQRFDTDNPEPDGAMGEDAAASTAALAVSRHQQQQHETSSREWFKGMFPKDNARNTRYAINFFTSIGLGPLTDGMREFLKNAPKLILAQAQAAAAREAAAAQKDGDESSVISSTSSDTSSASSSSSGSSSTSSSSFSSSSSSSYSSDSRYRRKKSSGKDRGRGRKRGRSRSRSYSSSSSSSSGSDSSRDGRKKKYSSKTKRSRRSNNRDRDSGNEGASKATTPSNGSKRRSVSESPTPARGRRRRSYSSSRSRSRSPGGDGGSKKRMGNSGDDRRRKSPPEEVEKSKQKEKRVTQKRGRSSSWSNSSRSHSPPVRKESLKRNKDGGRKRSRRARRSDSRSVSSGHK